MFFNPDDLPKIIDRTATVILALDDDTKLPVIPAFTIEPDSKTNKISINQIRTLIENSTTKQQAKTFTLIKSADKITPEAENAFLKLIEEPKENYHFILLTKNPSALLPTILSRAQIFYPREASTLDQPPKVPEKTLNLAKRLLVAKPQDLPALSDEIGKSKTARETALTATATAIDLAVKSYFKTSNKNFLANLEKLLLLHKNLEKNGNVKLHIVADLC